MSNWVNKGVIEMRQAEVEGKNLDDVLQQILADNATNIRYDAETRLGNAFKAKQRNEWANPAEQETQLRFPLDGMDFAIPETPVRYIDGDGEERFKSARRSTGEEREASINARHSHHLGHLIRSEAEAKREASQNSAASLQGIDLYGTPWDEVRHRDTVCWRCLQGYRHGDPFELGHSDRPESQGGTQTRWEHMSCNRSEKDNPVADPKPF